MFSIKMNLPHTFKFSVLILRLTVTLSLQKSIKYLQNLISSQRVFLRQVCTVASLILVMPATITASERSFSTLRRVKSYLKSTMK